MKKLLLSTISVLVLLISCQSKSEKDAHSSGRSVSLQVKVGENNNGEYTITYQDAIKENWETRLAQKGKKADLKDFTIIKGVTEGDSAEPYYLLSANNADKKLRVAALLRLEGKTFHFITNQDQHNSNFYSLIICEGSCETGCMPTVSSYGGTKYINCSSCADCRKNETEIR
jgi:hypothetical protein